MLTIPQKCCLFHSHRLGTSHHPHLFTSPSNSDGSSEPELGWWTSMVKNGCKIERSWDIFGKLYEFLWFFNVFQRVSAPKFKDHPKTALHFWFWWFISAKRLGILAFRTSLGGFKPVQFLQFPTHPFSTIKNTCVNHQPDQCGLYMFDSKKPSMCITTEALHSTAKLNGMDHGRRGICHAHGVVLVLRQLPPSQPQIGFALGRAEAPGVCRAWGGFGVVFGSKNGTNPTRRPAKTCSQLNFDHVTVAQMRKRKRLWCSDRRTQLVKEESTWNRSQMSNWSPVRPPHWSPWKGLMVCQQGTPPIS